jgi:5-(carboxyamino)imidazole ribonucleotide mutase
MSFVAILMGSNSDWPVMQNATDVLSGLHIEHEVRVTSAHRTPAATMEYVEDATGRGCGVFICAAGMAAHLAGVVAAHTTRPVIGVPVDSGSLSGFDALLSTVQMPGGIPVACVAIGKAGARNAAYLAGQILALADPSLAQRLSEDRQANAEKVRAQNQQLQTELKK